MSDNSVKLNVGSFACAFGLIWGIGMLLVAWFSWWFGWAHAFVYVMSSAYLGLAPTFVGGIFGFLWGFADFFLFGAFVALVYNFCLRCNCPVTGKKSKAKKK
jgi:hypothetical protein